MTSDNAQNIQSDLFDQSKKIDENEIKNNNLEKYKLIEYTFISSNLEEPPVIYIQKILKIADVAMLKQSISKTHSIPKEEIFICEIWQSKIHREFHTHDSVADIKSKTDDIFVYHVPKPQIDSNIIASFDSSFSDSKSKKMEDFKTVVIFHQHRVKAKNFFADRKRYEDEAFGYPLLITLCMKRQISVNELRQRLGSMISPFMVDSSISLEDEQIPFHFWATWGISDFYKLLPSNEVFDLKKNNLKFLVHWSDATQFHSQLKDRINRVRDKSADIKEDKEIDNNNKQPKEKMNDSSVSGKENSIEFEQWLLSLKMKNKYFPFMIDAGIASLSMLEERFICVTDFVRFLGETPMHEKDGIFMWENMPKNVEQTNINNNRDK